MNKNDLVASVADSSGLSKADAGKAVDSVLDNITSALQGGNEVRLVGFGTFSVAQRKATTGRNPQTGATIQIPA
ncbi:MAG: HU family DNA-binding protein, partial [Rhodospirillaceae bacterium]